MCKLRQQTVEGLASVLYFLQYFRHDIFYRVFRSAVESWAINGLRRTKSYTSVTNSEIVDCTIVPNNLAGSQHTSGAFATVIKKLSKSGTGVSRGEPAPAYVGNKLYCLMTEANVCERLVRQCSGRDWTHDLQSQVQHSLPRHLPSSAVVTRFCFTGYHVVRTVIVIVMKLCYLSSRFVRMCTERYYVLFGGCDPQERVLREDWRAQYKRFCHSFCSLWRFSALAHL